MKRRQHPPGMQPRPQQQTFNVDKSSLEEVKCSHCGHAYFTQGLTMQFLSKFLSPGGEPMYVATAVNVCLVCWTPLPAPEEFARMKDLKVAGEGGEDNEEESN